MIATDSELRDIAEQMRIQYWMTLGDDSHLEHDPSPESGEAWLRTARVAEAYVAEVLLNRPILDAADNVAAALPTEGLPEGELRMALGNFRRHQAKRSSHHGALCAKCVRTAERLVDAANNTRSEIPA